MFYVHDSQEKNFLERKTNESSDVLENTREWSVDGGKWSRKDQHEKTFSKYFEHDIHYLEQWSAF